MDNDTVTISVKDRKENTKKTVTLSGVKFIRKFLMHVLSKWFVKISHYWQTATKRQNLNCAGTLQEALYINQSLKN